MVVIPVIDHLLGVVGVGEGHLTPAERDDEHGPDLVLGPVSHHVVRVLPGSQAAESSGPMAHSTAATTSSSNASRRWPYVSTVVVTGSWPRRRWMAGSSASAAISHDAWECRRS
ncbi:hypothetical protein BIV25_16375 [Streptomyces sp. MUSC 14]|nr:hypothetical protein BIV25_16375 [Streptomyces sp. MUSC 14]